MATFTLNGTPSAYKDNQETPGMFSRLYTNFVESRRKEAQIYVDSYLRSLNERTLQDMGFSSVEINRLKKGETLSKVRPF